MARELRRHEMVGSMGRVGAAGDNAAMESFWSLLQTNVLNQQRWTTDKNCDSPSWSGSSGSITGNEPRTLSVA